MKVILTSDQVRIPPQVTAALNRKEVTVTGPRGFDTRDFKNTQLELELKDEGHTLEVRCWLADKKTRAIVGTACGHIRNMITGVLAGYRITMILLNKHFPLNLEFKAKGKAIQVRNYMGTRKNITVNAQGNVLFKDTANPRQNSCFIEGINIEDTSQTAAKLFQALRDDKKKDPVKFIDGIYKKSLELIDPDSLGSTTS